MGLSDVIIFDDPVKCGLRCIAASVASDRNFEKWYEPGGYADFHAVGTGKGLILLYFHYLWSYLECSFYNFVMSE